MSGFPNVRLDPDPGASEDFQRFIASKVYQLSTQRSSSDNLHTSTESALQERGKEIFLWVGFCHVDSRHCGNCGNSNHFSNYHTYSWVPTGG